MVSWRWPRRAVEGCGGPSGRPPPGGRTRAYRVEQVPGRSRQPVESCHHEHVAINTLADVRMACASRPLECGVEGGAGGDQRRVGIPAGSPISIPIPPILTPRRPGRPLPRLFLNRNSAAISRSLLYRKFIGTWLRSCRSSRAWHGWHSAGACGIWPGPRWRRPTRSRASTGARSTSRAPSVEAGKETGEVVGAATGAAAGAAGLLEGAGVGAVAGSVVPVVGTAIGGILGALGGALLGGFVGHKVGGVVGRQFDEFTCLDCGKKW